MQEIEGKILEVDTGQLCKQLEQMGAAKIHEGDIITTYFEDDNESMHTRGLTLRVRQFTDTVSLMLKRILSKTDAKIAEEVEVKVSDYDSAVRFLSALGFRKTKERKKHRISYQKGGYRFDIDTHPGVPTFLEIEAPSAEALRKMAARLGYSSEDIKTWTGKELLEHYRRSA